MGKAIPNAEILVVRPDGTPCAPDEPGELVQRGALVGARLLERSGEDRRALQAGARRSGTELPLTEMAVWSGDTVRTDEDGFLYFVGRRDEMIKTSGYRVSPTEVEEVVYATGLVGDAVAVGAPHPALGEGHRADRVAARLRRRAGRRASVCSRIAARGCRPTWCRTHRVAASLPRNPNGKFDRPALAARVRDCFGGAGMTLDAFSQHPAHPWFDGTRWRARGRRQADLRDRGRRRTHAVLCLRSRGHDAQGRDAARGSAGGGGPALRDQGESDARRRATTSRAWSTVSMSHPRRELARRARHGRESRRDQLRRSGQDRGGARAGRRRRHRHQRGVAARDAAARRARAAQRLATARSRCASIPTSSSSPPA